ncbi:ribonuclease H-like domain-containing protein [Nitrosospira multiformis]|uniref:ribonuclease H-like domain-containing protein n=1 Tax=Nitrosospira multiformis TaxID=1231 RepID=UPI00089A70D5|nr:ribonuclease H-like domain-containing protein [Nitrosospira multiformis]SEA18509.1 Uncharacterized conserved protein YprB, contains RNaseH-like and TPR domains [Nitrosospira multiformis]
MLPFTFQHIKGISSKKERELWRMGIASWDELEAAIAPQALLFEDRCNWGIQSILAQSRRAFQEKDVEFFCQRLSRQEHYRIALAFLPDTLFIDIETTGLSRFYDYITIVGWSIGGQYGVYIKGGDETPLVSAIQKAKAIVTFNGTLFDLPFLKQEFPHLDIPQAHVDLRFFSKRHGFSGGQKSIEKQLGLVRDAGIQDIAGEAAPILWHRYRRGDPEALKLLIEYNHADIEGMKFIFDKTARQLVQQNGLPKMEGMLEIFSDLGSKIVWYKTETEYSSGAIRITPYREKTCPFIRINDLIDINARQKLRVVGIDLSGSESKLSGWCFLDGSHASTNALASDDDLVDATLKVKPELVSIDSPLSLPLGRVSVDDDDPGRQTYGIMRYCERILKKRGVNVYPALIPSMRRLTARGIRLAQRFRKMGIPVIESYPGAAQDIMNIPRKRAGLEFLREGLAEFGIEGNFCQDRITHDELDAITSAVVGVFFWSGMFERLGNEIDPEEALIIPDLHVDPTSWRQRSVIGLSGPLAAGKTTVARFLIEKGYCYGRFSQVVEAVLKERAIPVTRQTLQELGEELHHDPGQRWLGHQLAKRFPKEGNVVVDGIRFPEDRALLIETFGPAFYHIHLQASPNIRKQRFYQREGTSTSFEVANTHNVEARVNELAELADKVIRNEGELSTLQMEIETLPIFKVEKVCQ